MGSTPSILWNPITSNSAWRVDNPESLQTSSTLDYIDDEISFFANSTRSSWDPEPVDFGSKESHPAANAESHEAQVSTASTSSSELDISSVTSLITAADSGDSLARTTLQALAGKAKKIPKKQRSDAQRLVLTWKRRSTEGNLEIFVDASETGIGLVFRDTWLAWRFLPAAELPRGPDGQLITSWAELVAVEMGIRALLSASYKNMKVVIRSDNRGVVKALTKRKWKERYDLEKILDGIFLLCKSAGFHMKVKWVSTKNNPADKPSRGIYPASESRFDCPPVKLPIHLEGLIEEVRT